MPILCKAIKLNDEKIASGKAEAYVQFNPGGELGTKLRYGAWESPCRSDNFNAAGVHESMCAC